MQVGNNTHIPIDQYVHIICIKWNDHLICLDWESLKRYLIYKE